MRTVGRLKMQKGPRQMAKKDTTGIWTKEKMQELLDICDIAVEKAVLRIYSFQTEGEKLSFDTYEDNGVGFSAYDAEIMSSFAEQIKANKYGKPDGERLTFKQMAIARKKIRSYWRQLCLVANENQNPAGKPEAILAKIKESQLPPVVVIGQPAEIGEAIPVVEDKERIALIERAREAKAHMVAEG